MAEDALLFEKRAGVATLILNRPEARNALTSAMFLDMERMLLEIAEDPDVRVVVLTGTGRGFSAGADLKQTSRRPSGFEPEGRTRTSPSPPATGPRLDAPSTTRAPARSGA